jgi:hypothetical protein
MTPREHLDQVVRPNLADLAQDPASIRKAYNAVQAINALAAHIFWAVGKAAIGEENDDQYRGRLAKESFDFSILRDAAIACKHVKLRERRLISGVDDLKVEALGGWGDAPFCAGPSGGWSEIEVRLDTGERRQLSGVLARSLALLEAKMVGFGL